MVPRAGIEPARPLSRSGGFSYPPRLSSPPSRRGLRCLGSGARLGHDALHAIAGHVRPPPSALYTFLKISGLARRCLGRLRVAQPPGGSPTLMEFTPAVSALGAQIVQVRCVYQFHHRGNVLILRCQRADAPRKTINVPRGPHPQEIIHALKGESIRRSAGFAACGAAARPPPTATDRQW